MACDANHMTFKMIEQQWQIPRFVLDLTGPDSPGALEMVETQLRQLAAFLEQKTEQKLMSSSCKRLSAGKIILTAIIEKHWPYLKNAVS